MTTAIFVNGPIGCCKSYDVMNLGLSWGTRVPEYHETFSSTLEDFYAGKISALEFNYEFIKHTLSLQAGAFRGAGATGTTAKPCDSSIICDSCIIQHLTFS